MGVPSLFGSAGGRGFAGLAVLLVPLAAGCAVRSAESTSFREPGRVITASDIRTLGAADAWDALRRSGALLTTAETRSGNPVTLRKRGHGSVVLGATPLVVQDGVHLTDFRLLRNVPAPIIHEIRILNGVDGTLRYGTGGGNGVIVVTTRELPAAN